MHEVLRHGVYDVMRSCVHDVLRQDTEFVEDADTVSFAGGFDEASEDELEEGLVINHVESEFVVCGTDSIDDNCGARTGEHGPCCGWLIEGIEAEDSLPGVELVAAGSHEYYEYLIGAG